ncbi:hypothetical protein A3A70_02065 [candidate division WWE3 bacterium RIFCSPLOWO2_01_FULL_42_11]|uniref:Uncharacterized protein n=1 Tax=candidate division WWE3 bacterium RIFCSPLOWO2_01_FULL_42_11 TaxID=1802627 RepID=A0A1F4VRR9_UNCKA|nr:MAG: hypothetical protein A3A70_02065 [candidate division WWE3 bacterium RIFCSPLOWO2_01_FULL_42_11]
MYSNAEHPELRVGEVWLTNADHQEFATIGFRTKRLGCTAYDVDGNPIRGGDIQPVFVSRQEQDRFRRKYSAG